MKYFRSALIILAGAAAAIADTCAAGKPNCFNVPTGGYQSSAGSSLALSWNPTTSGTVSLLLRTGNSAYLDNGYVIAGNLTNSGSYTWQVPSNIVRGNTYAIEIVSDSDPSQVNYTPQFSIDSTVLYTSTSSGASVSSTSAASTSGVTMSSTSMTGSMTTTMTSSHSGTTSAASSTSQSAGLQTTRSTTANGAARATAVAGLLGVIAFGAIAL